ncbi:hypothetical protein SAMN06272789_6665 [Streptomyces sp. 1331.2]|nr:hypothetical protein SAMN06272789_0087 [Streptomyces sp. 1331.2]SOB86353.1 hypothetical protein SAMN06272789_6665 [Streptomyces sp. 1331.2]
MRLVLTAKHLLDTGATLAQAYAALARRTRAPLRCARAVCTALGIPAAETARRHPTAVNKRWTTPRGRVVHRLSAGAAHRSSSRPGTRPVPPTQDTRNRGRPCAPPHASRRWPR